jgi:excisionase family DNA binding protein
LQTLKNNGILAARKFTLKPTKRKKESRLLSEQIQQPITHTVEDVARILQMHAVTVRRKIRQGKIQAFMTNGDSGEYRITQEALDAYMAFREKLVEVASE